MDRLSRREVVGSLGCSAAAAVAGCVGWAGPARPEYDCSQAFRPTPAPPENPEAVEPASYPDPPADPEEQRYLVDYVESFEAAYRRNLLVSSNGDALVGYGFASDETWTEEATADAGVAGVQYYYWHEVEERTGVVHADSGTQVAVYYVDESVALRAHEGGRRQEDADPDPREEGREVACFE